MSFDPRKSTSKTFHELNPHLFRLGAAVGKPHPVAALDQDASRAKRDAQSVAGGVKKVRVTIVTCRSRLLDSDNHIAGCKGLRDIIADWLGTDDADAG